MRYTNQLLALVMLLPALVLADAPAKPAAEEAEPKEAAEPMAYTSQHSVKIAGQRVKYTATAGSLIMRDDEGEAVAEFGYTAYTKDGADPATRPLMFAWNGGPGSASMWLHMGVLGPQRTVVEDLKINGAGPFRRVANEFSILDKVDLVMVDPIGTGYSRPLGDSEGKEFWGVDNDIKSVSEFIVRYTSDNGRWMSPKYILGESYGGIRAGGVSYYLLNNHNLSLNGVVLVSPYMDVAGGGGVGVANLVVGYTMALSTYAATAYFHDALEDKPADFLKFLAEVDEFAIGPYLQVLVKGARASDAERQSVAEQLAQYTGTTAEYWLAANFRVREGQFVAELLRDRGKLVGRIDSRYGNYATHPLAGSMTYDPFTGAVGPAFVATFNDYYKRELGVDVDRPYVVSGNLWQHWDRSHKDPQNPWSSPVADTGIDLGHAMIMNPHMKILVQAGYFDLATPYRASEYFIDQLPVPDSIRDNVAIEYYEAGHMMYVHPPSLVKYRKDLADFIDATH